jgi:hypothetical protein
MEIVIKASLHKTATAVLALLHQLHSRLCLHRMSRGLRVCDQVFANPFLEITDLSDERTVGGRAYILKPFKTFRDLLIHRRRSPTEPILFVLSRESSCVYYNLHVAT